jgi:hypothetical protein
MMNLSTTILRDTVGRARSRPRLTVVLAAAVLVFGALGSQALAAGRLGFAPEYGPVGTAVTAQASGLTPGAHLTLAWQTADASWQVGNGAFNGVRATTVQRTVAQGVVAEDGTLTLHFTVPEDYGYTHNLFLLDAQGNRVARQGFVVSPQLTVTPTSGPVGTPIHIRFTGLGYRFFHLAWHLLYDGGNTGILTGLSTHGTAEATIPATGTVGPHTLQVIVGTHSSPYLNEQQSPIYVPQIPLVQSALFTVTAGPAVTRTAASQDLPRTPGRAAPPSDQASPSLALDYASGTVGSPTILRGYGFPPSSAVKLTWSTVVGNRISGAGWQESTRAFATVTSGADGSFVYRFDTPDDLGGVHHIEATAGSAKAQADYTIKPSAFEVSPRTVAPGGDLTVHLKGVGWTATANIYTLVMDNHLFGYACGFNSQGDVVIHIKAPGRAGPHVISLYPSIYKGDLKGPGAPTSTANANYLLMPMLNVADHPGERLPAFQLSFTVSGSATTSASN